MIIYNFGDVVSIAFNFKVNVPSRSLVAFNYNVIHRHIFLFAYLQCSESCY